MVDAPDDKFARPEMYVGRYAIFPAIAKGGFASVHLARSIGAGNFARTVAIKRLHRQFAQDPEVSAMFLDEAHLVARIRHPNVLPTLDLVAGDEELMIVMEYVEGVTLRYLQRHARKRKRQVPLGVVLRCIVSALRGLHAAHEARNERGERLEIIHRDFSPDNILIGTDGLVRILDFGVAKALGQYHDTRAGEVRGKLAYMTPEQVNDEPLTHRSDLFSAGIVLWEAMTGDRLFSAKSITATAHRVLTREVPLPSEVAGTPRKLDGIVLQALERDPSKRWQNAERFAAALEAVGSLAGEGTLAQYVQKAGAERLRERARQVQAVEATELDLGKLHVPKRASMTGDEIRSAVANRQVIAPSEPAPAAEPPSGGETSPTATMASAPLAEHIEHTQETPLGTWSDARQSFSDRSRAVLPVLTVALAIVVVALLFVGEDEETEVASDGPAAEATQAARAEPPEKVARSAAPAPSRAAPEPKTDASTSAKPESSAPPPEKSSPVPVSPPPRPHVVQPTPKPPPLYGRE